MGSINFLAILLVAGVGTGQPAEADADWVAAGKNGEFLAKYYPRGAASAGQQGLVEFEIMIEKQGWISSCTVTRSSGFALLDKETCEIIVKFARLQPSSSQRGRRRDKGFINWQLPAGIAPAAPVVSAMARNEPNDPIICKRDPKVGSKIVKIRQCLTAREWALQERQWRDETDRIVGRGYTNGRN
jgi:TonB family protein